MGTSDVPGTVLSTLNHLHNSSTFCIYELTILIILYDWNYTIFLILWQAYFTYHSVFKVHPRR